MRRPVSRTTTDSDQPRSNLFRRLGSSHANKRAGTLLTLLTCLLLAAVFLRSQSTAPSTSPLESTSGSNSISGHSSIETSHGFPTHPLLKPHTMPIVGGGGGNADAGFEPLLEPSTLVTLSFAVSEGLQTAWRKSSKRESFSSQLRVTTAGGHSLETPMIATFYGKSSIKIKYTRRRSLHVQLGEATSLYPGCPPLKEFLLLSLWEDRYRLAYRSSIELLRSLGLLHAHARLVELRCTPQQGSNLLGASSSSIHGAMCASSATGSTLGAYLLIEYPSAAIERVVREDLFSNLKHQPDTDRQLSLSSQRLCEPDGVYQTRREQMDRLRSDAAHVHLEVATRNWFYFEKPKNYDLLHVPSYKRNSSLSQPYRQVEQLLDRATVPFDLNLYMTWIAFNTLVENGDYDDEVFFYRLTNAKRNAKDQEEDRGSSAQWMSIMAWDYDTVFASCHRQGTSVTSTELMFCAESPMEHKIAQDATLFKEYRSIMSCLLTKGATVARWKASLAVALTELQSVLTSSRAAVEATFEENKKGSGRGDYIPDVKKGSARLLDQFTNQHQKLQRLLNIGAEGDDDGHPANVVAGQEGGAMPNGEGRVCPAPSAAWTSSLTSAVRARIATEYKGKGLIDDFQTSLSVKPKQRGGAKTGATVSFKKISAEIVTPSGSLQTISTQTSGGRIQLTEPGLYCAKVTAEAAEPATAASSSLLRCDSAAVFVPFVVRSAKRGKAEFGLPHFQKPHPMTLTEKDPKCDAAAAHRALGLFAVVPRRWIWSTSTSWFPAVVIAGHQQEEEERSTWLWARQNVPLRLAEDPTAEASTTSDSNQKRTLLPRGFAAVKIAPLALQTSLRNDVDGPLLFRGETSRSIQLALNDDLSTSSIHVGTPQSVDSAITPVPLIPPKDAAGSMTTIVHPAGALVRVLHDVVIPAGMSLTLSEDSLLEMAAGVTVTVRGSLLFNGSLAAPVVVSSTTPSTRWVTFLVEGESAMVRSTGPLFVVGSGVKGRVVASTGHHHTHSAAFTAINGGQLDLAHTYILDSAGPAFAAGGKAQIQFQYGLVQWAELGMECVNCDVRLDATAWLNFPTWDAAYLDEDNDGLYLSGGEHRMERSVIAHAKDDGIDTGTPEHSQGNGGSFVLQDTVVEMCQHEGIALSSSPGASRTVQLNNVVVAHCQQGIESGYTGAGHTATANGVLVHHTHVGIRYGDNYHKRPQLGSLKVKDAFLAANQVNILNYVRQYAAAAPADRLDVSHSQLYPALGSGVGGEAQRMTAEWCGSLHEGRAEAEFSNPSPCTDREEVKKLSAFVPIVFAPAK